MADCIITQGQDASPERRSNSDRRSGTFPQAKYWGRRGRRRKMRRHEERQDAYLDWYPARFMWITGVTLCLCGVDAILTLTLLQQGAVEINPFMAMLISANTTLFVGVKMGLTALALACLIVHHNFTMLRSVRVQQLIYGVMFFYFGLVVYESLLLAEPFVR